MRRIIFCQEPMFLAQGRLAFSDGTAALYVVDDEEFEGRLAEAGCDALSGDFRDPSVYQRARIGPDDQILVQVQDEALMAAIVDNLFRLTRPPSVAVVNEPTAPPLLFLPASSTSRSGTCSARNPNSSCGTPANIKMCRTSGSPARGRQPAHSHPARPGPGRPLPVPWPCGLFSDETGRPLPLALSARCRGQKTLRW